MKLTPINNIKSTLYILCTISLVMNISACDSPPQAVTKEVSPEKITEEEVFQNEAFQDDEFQDDEFQDAVYKDEIKTLKEEMKTLKEDMQALKKSIQTPKEKPQTSQIEIQTPKEEPQTSQTEIQTPKEEPQIAKEGVLAVSSSNNISSEVGQKILTVGHKMAVETKEIIKGSCWDYINAVYNRAGYPVHQRVTIYESNKDKGPYADTDTIQAGDWLYYINHSYNGIEHSGIFVNWVDESKKIANILSYGGEQRQEPGRYRDYDLSNVYTIIRAENKVKIPKQK